MAVKVIIKRMVPEESQKGLMPLLRRLRVLANHQEGYISGETLQRIDRPGQYLVISTWRSLDDWRKWSLSGQRKEIQDEIDRLLGEETEYEIYSYA